MGEECSPLPSPEAPPGAVPHSSPPRSQRVEPRGLDEGPAPELQPRAGHRSRRRGAQEEPPRRSSAGPHPLTEPPPSTARPPRRSRGPSGGGAPPDTTAGHPLRERPAGGNRPDPPPPRPSECAPSSCPSPHGHPSPKGIAHLPLPIDDKNLIDPDPPDLLLPPLGLHHASFIVPLLGGERGESPLEADGDGLLRRPLRLPKVFPATDHGGPKPGGKGEVLHLASEPQIDVHDIPVKIREIEAKGGLPPSLHHVGLDPKIADPRDPRARWSGLEIEKGTPREECEGHGTPQDGSPPLDRKSTRLNSSHG